MGSGAKAVLKLSALGLVIAGILVYRWATKSTTLHETHRPELDTWYEYELKRNSASAAKNLNSAA